MVVGPLARWLTTTWDWRLAMLVIGDVGWLVIIPAALLVREPGTTVEARGRIVDDGEGLSVRQALRCAALGPFIGQSRLRDRFVSPSPFVYDDREAAMSRPNASRISQTFEAIGCEGSHVDHGG